MVEVKKRKTKGGFKRKNVGIFQYFKEYFADERKKNGNKMTTLKFTDVYDHMKDLYEVDEERLATYLHDKRMLKGIIVKFSKKNNEIVI